MFRNGYLARWLLKTYVLLCLIPYSSRYEQPHAIRGAGEVGGAACSYLAPTPTLNRVR